MKYGIRNGSLRQEWREAYATAGVIGFEGLEICVTRDEHMPLILDPSVRKEAKELAAAAGVETCAISYGILRQGSFIDPDPAVREHGVTLLHQAIEAAADLGGDAILCPTFERQNIDINPQQTETYVAAFKECTRAAEDAGIMLALETSFSVELLCAITEAIGSPSVCVYQDLSNALFYGHDPVDMLARLADRIGMIHIKETDQKPLGEGDVDWEGSLQAIDDMGYDGWLVFETGPGDDPVAMAQRNLDWLKGRMG
ncbi:MAG: sugar phosphate isomerase/epimerase [Lentisphaerae bacterium]|nr:sugar phosphate isomerase/epimerase [Lentisphaerota bacterium]MBT4822236.1 sugar phosphate isomerase/epimerase [Lentisphaerota bacterium]MBT5605066.1 sugar phosphate isomerase/epimerase [Lentisphaerota bacterium]MBT7058688.1 sugar phosphate isomerase/epimerase [Lentisphaerota bacterium]MBT7847029.1 sugar phosphate isomerase/epimerase [Lentisphaerota bacterium]